MGVSNLECFLARSTPVVQSRFLPKSFNGSQQAKTVLEYFKLGDLWDCFDEWSAYGLGSPIVLNRRETVVQYYTPYLSAIQLYIAKPESSSDLSDDCEAKSWSSDGEEWRLSRSSSSNSDKTWDMEDSGDGLENSWSERDWVGELYFEHFERDGPFGRVPLKDKVDALSHKNWGLRSLNSIDLSPASWVAIAWYPIYHIPTSRNAKNLYASFLTYHNLSSFQDNTLDGTENGAPSLEESEQQQPFGCGEIHLHPFGMASYRMQRRVWVDHEGGSDHQSISSLMAAADSWLKQLKVQHHDYNFFVSHFA